MVRCKRKITKEQYDRATNGYLDREDYCKIFSEAERWGYGVYCDQVFEENGEYFVAFSMGESCD